MRSRARVAAAIIFAMQVTTRMHCAGGKPGSPRATCGALRSTSASMPRSRSRSATWSAHRVSPDERCCKYFRDFYGVSPMRYLRNHRLQRVRDDLLGRENGASQRARIALGLRAPRALRRRVPQALRRMPFGYARPEPAGPVSGAGRRVLDTRCARSGNCAASQTITGIPRCESSPFSQQR